MYYLMIDNYMSNYGIISSQSKCDVELFVVS